jgi:hypothetical protein
MKKQQTVKVMREELAPSLVASLPNFIFWNAGKISKVAGERILVRWNTQDRYWFDADQLISAQEAK